MGFQGNFKIIECFDVIVEYVTCVLRVFLGCFCSIDFAWVDVMTSVHKRKPFLIKTHPKTPLKHKADTFESFWKHSWNDLEAPSKYLWNTIKTPTWTQICISHVTMIVKYKKNCTFSSDQPLNLCVWIYFLLGHFS